MSRFTISAAVAITALAATSSAEGPQPPKDDQKLAVSKAIDPATQKVTELKSQAREITRKIGELALNQDLTTDDESVKTLQDLVKELAQINQQLRSVEADLAEIKGWIAGQDKSLPVLTKDVERLKRFKFSNYAQFQWSDTQNGQDSKGKSLNVNDGFQMRRLRLGGTYTIDAKTSMKLSFDVATGSQRTSAELKDAMLITNFAPGFQAVAGQQNIPLGYEIERSSSEREFPERALYNRTLFAGERGRGVTLKYSLGPSSTLQLGLMNNLSLSDPQQTDANTFRDLSGTEPAITAGLRHSGKNYQVGVSGFFGKRAAMPSKTTTAWTDANNNGQIDAGEVKNTVNPGTDGADRRLVYLDAAYTGLFDPRISIRGEFMFGHDRVPTMSGGVPKFVNQTNVQGYQIQLNYALNYRNTLSFRYEAFDPDTGLPNDAINIWGLAWNYYFNPGSRLTLAHERVEEQGFDPRNDVTTIRLQFKL